MPLDGVKNIILVLSGKGGVGKSSVTLQLALALTLQGKSVGILDIDLTGPSIPRLVGLEDAKITQTPKGWLPVLVHDAEEGPPHETKDPQESTTPETKKNKKKARGSLRCMSLGFLLRDRGDAVIWRGPKKTAMIRQFLTDVFWGETDYLLVDTPPGTSDEHIALAEQLLTVATVNPTLSNNTSTSSSSSDPSSLLPRLAGAVLVTTPQAIATADVRKEINFCVKTRIPTLGVIENMSGYACPCCGEVTNLFSSGGGQVMAREMEVPFLGTVPVDVKFGELVEGKLEEEDESDDEEDESDDEEDERMMEPAAAKKVESDDRPLVERYKDCWSLSRFEDVAKTLISKIEA